MLSEYFAELDSDHFVGNIIVIRQIQPEVVSSLEGLVKHMNVPFHRMEMVCMELRLRRTRKHKKAA